MKTALAVTLGALAGMAITACQAPTVAQKPIIIPAIPASPEISPDRGPVEATDAITMLAALPIEPENAAAHYKRDEWKHWISQGNHCDTRELVISVQGSDATGNTKAPVDPATCEALPGGRWLSLYDGVTVTDPAMLDVDHVVPLEEMAQSTRGWSAELRQRYANDTDVLEAVTRTSNRTKGSKDPAEWMPPSSTYRCSYAYGYMLAKWKYNAIAGPVTVDQAEHDDLAATFAACPPESIGLAPHETD